MPFQQLSGEDDLSEFTISQEDIMKIPSVMRVIESFDGHDLNNETFQELCNHCFWLIERIPLPLHYVDSTFIVRSRENFNSEIFNEQGQISYHSRDFDKIGVGRFNRPQEPMFYGALKGNDHKGDNVPTATLECCKRIFEPGENNPFYDFTLGRWMIKQPFYVINLLYHHKTMENNPHIKSYLDGYFDQWAKKFSIEVHEHVKAYMRFFSSIAATPKPTMREYFISNAFWLSVREYFIHTEKTLIPGIVYPSWITEFNGVNIALITQAVDDFLQLDGVGMYRYLRDENNPKEFHCGPLCDLVEVANGKFTLPPLKFDFPKV
jgi:hypothetical protein